MAEAKTYYSALGKQYITGRLSQSRFAAAPSKVGEPAEKSSIDLVPCLVSSTLASLSSSSTAKSPTYKTIQLDHPQWPFDLKNDESENFKECPVCLLESKEIKCCVLFVSCRHRFCKECAEKIVASSTTECPVCRNLLPESDEKQRITLVLHGDEIWWTPTTTEENKQSLTSAADELCHTLFGTINRIHTARVFHIYSFKDVIKISDARGKKLRLEIPHAQVRGIDTSPEKQKYLLQSLILALLYFHYSQAIAYDELTKFITDQWPQTKQTDIDAVIAKLIKDEYCKWSSEGMLKYVV